MHTVGWLWVSFRMLPWWAELVWTVYVVYFVGRSWYIWIITRDEGIKKGYKYVFLGGNPKFLRLYHILRVIIDIPPAILGLFFPLLRAIFRLKLYQFKEKEKKEGISDGE